MVVGARNSLMCSLSSAGSELGPLHVPVPSTYVLRALSLEDRDKNDKSVLSQAAFFFYQVTLLSTLDLQPMQSYRLTQIHNNILG